MRPRCVLVERSTEYRDLLARHGTRAQARFSLAGDGLEMDEVEARDRTHADARRWVLGRLPGDWRVASVNRPELDRFLFEPWDVVIVLGQDGLVANAAKYLDGQTVIGLNPDPERNPGVLVRHAPTALPDLLADLAADRLSTEARTMVAAELDDGQRLLALNEVFIGHPTHQSARYRLRCLEGDERQSSSGVVVTTGTGATGWAASINRQRARPIELPRASDPRLAWFVREPWPSPATSTTLDAGTIAAGESLLVTSELGDGATVFGDGIEADHLTIDWGQSLAVRVADQALRLAA